MPAAPKACGHRHAALIDASARRPAACWPRPRRPQRTRQAWAPAEIATTLPAIDPRARLDAEQDQRLRRSGPASAWSPPSSTLPLGRRTAALGVTPLRTALRQPQSLGQAAEQGGPGVGVPHRVKQPVHAVGDHLRRPTRVAATTETTTAITSTTTCPTAPGCPRRARGRRAPPIAPHVGEEAGELTGRRRRAARRGLTSAARSPPRRTWRTATMTTASIRLQVSEGSRKTCCSFPAARCTDHSLVKVDEPDDRAGRSCRRCSSPTETSEFDHVDGLQGSGGRRSRRWHWIPMTALGRVAMDFGRRTTNHAGDPHDGSRACHQPRTTSRPATSRTAASASGVHDVRPQLAINRATTRSAGRCSTTARRSIGQAFAERPALLAHGDDRHRCTDTFEPRSRRAGADESVHVPLPRTPR